MSTNHQPNQANDFAPSVRIRASSVLAAAVVLVIAFLIGCVGEVSSSGAQSPERQGAQRDADADPFAPGAVETKKPESGELTTEDLPKQPNEINRPSLVQILAHRERYDGKDVQVMGFLRVEFEGTAIYLSKEDADYGIARNGFWVDLSRRAAKHDRKYVLIEGTFDKDSLGHMSRWQGTITNVTRIVELTKHE